MHDYQRDFIELALAHQVLSFGQFTLKSGRRSPYFFNAGRFDSGVKLAGLGRAYAAAIDAWGLDFDVLLGPAYKGIPLAAATSVELAEQYGRDVPWSFNRKEAKDHGEGGLFVGAPVSGRVLVIDDVITAGTAIREVIDLVAGTGAELAGVIVAIDRQERGTGELSAVGQVRADHGIDVRAIVTLDDVVDYVAADTSLAAHLPAMREYRSRFGA
jgi:orotate phosphoribosyltransferase